MFAVSILFVALIHLCLGRPEHAATDVSMFDGKNAVPHVLPSMAFIVVDTYKSYVKCGGVLVHRKYILTAASCVQDLLMDSPAKNCTAHLGAHEYLRFDDYHKAHCSLYPSDVAPKKNGVNSVANDVALVYIAGGANLKKGRVSLAYMAYAATSPASDHVYDGKMATIYGWGYGTSGKWAPPGVLQTLDGVVVPYEKCKHPGITSSKTLCVGRSDGKAGVATGEDLGGPVYVDHYLVGIMCRNPDGDRSTHVAVARVDYLREWIDATVARK